MNQIKNVIIAFICSSTLVAGLPSTALVRSETPEKILVRPRSERRDLAAPINPGQTSCSREQIFYQNGRMTGKLTFWNNQPWERTLIEYHDELSQFSVQTMIYHGERVFRVRKDLYQRLETDIGSDQMLKTWHYYFDKDRANSLRQIDTYRPGTTLVKKRQLFDENGGLKATALFEYNPDSANQEPDENQTIPAATRMTLKDKYGETILDYRETTEIDLDALYQNHHLTRAEIARRRAVARDRSRVPILIMDGGIDISHPEIAYKLWKNPLESPNGNDDDGNGLVDDIYGVSDNPRLGQPVQDLLLPRFGMPSFSHGTLVASIAVEGREDVAVMAASEITTIHSPEILPRVEHFIRKHGVRYTNMSFIFDKQLLASDACVERTYQIRQLINNTPETLHVAAAGNGAPINGKGYDVDKLRESGDLVPVMLTQDNLLTVGALDTDRLELNDYPDYQLADFTNVGERSVDILAPGARMCGAQMGGGTICQDGTSFAAPYLLNHGVLNVARANPHLNIYEIKEILMKTAYVPDLDNPFPVRCGGIVHPQRAVATAHWLAGHPAASVDEAVLAVRRAEPRPIAGESNGEPYLSALASFWALRRLGDAQSWYAQANQQADPATEARRRRISQ
jgi:subtilisin family serine protease